MEELLRVGEKLGKSSAENPLGANPDANRSPFDFFASQAAPQPAGGAASAPNAMPPQGMGGFSKEEMDMLFSGASAEDMQNMSPEEIEQYMLRYEKLITEKRTKEMHKANLNKVDHEGGAMVEPEPGFVIKSAFRSGTKHANAGQKLFINVCSHDLVERPHMHTIAPDDGSEVQEGMRIPVSVGAPIEDFDKKNEKCINVDVLVHPDVTKKCEEEAETKHSVMELALSAVQSKYKWSLDPQVKFPKIKYKGPVQYQRIRVTKKSEIQEVSGSSNGGASGDDSGAASSKTEDDIELVERPDFEIWYYKCHKSSPSSSSSSSSSASPGSSSTSEGASSASTSSTDEGDQSLQVADGSSPSSSSSVSGGGSSSSTKTGSCSSDNAAAEEKEIGAVGDDDDVINGFDLACYDQRREIRENLKKRGWLSTDHKSETKEAFEREKQEFLRNLVRNRIAVYRVKLPKLRRSNVHKYVQVTVSDEGFRLFFPSYGGRGGGGQQDSSAIAAAYLPLTIWFPRAFCSSQAEVLWDSSEKILEVRLPTDADESLDALLDDDLLHEVF
ncbi:unnamed protein product [Amoebophrya sp. A25]|nr:unnamed protein product [Amoebophrya sp. A25]|eukprot:GSA25T00018787001.1